MAAFSDVRSLNVRVRSGFILHCKGLLFMAQQIEQFEQRYRDLYTVESQNYDFHRFTNPQGQAFHTGEQRVIWDLLKLQPGQRMLDVAAGTGRIAAYLAEQGLDVVAFDLTPNMLRKARARVDPDAADNLRVVGGTGRKLPFADNYFEAVISIRFLHLLPVSLYRPFIQEMWRVLRPGGVLLVQFDSALAGGGSVWGRELYRRVMRGHKARHYFWPHQVGTVFAGIDNITLHGYSPFGGRLVRSIHVGTAQRLEEFLSEGQQGFLANQIFVRAVKPE